MTRLMIWLARLLGATFLNEGQQILIRAERGEIKVEMRS